jgi:hypothetical protein
MWKGIVVASAVTGCSASVKSFSVDPDHLCTKAQPVKLTWEVVGTGHMTSPAGTDGPNGTVDDQKSITIHPTGPGRIELHVTRPMGASTTSWQDIWFDEPAQSIAVGLDRPSAKCDPTVGVSATATISGFSDESRVTRVGPRHGDNHTYKISHAGKGPVSIDPSSATPSNTELAGTTISGDWVLEAAFLDGEACGQPSLPRTLGVEVYTACHGGVQ